MFIIIGYIIVFGSVIGGFMMSGGRVEMLIHVSEIIIIGGAAFGAFVASSTGFGLKGAMKGFIHAFTGKAAGKTEYIELLSVMSV